MDRKRELMKEQADLDIEDGGIMVSETDGAIRKRRKAIKQCLFCRKRKLKCDKRKPVCSTCDLRGLTECVYVDKYSHNVDAKELFESTPNVELLNRIKELEEELCQARGLTPLKSSKGDAATEFNPLLGSGFIESKNDRYTYFGPTSLRATVRENKLRFQKYYILAWKQLKDKRQKWKAMAGFSAMHEITSIELPQKFFYNDSVLSSMCKTLPMFEEIETMLTKFFNSRLHKGFQILDQEKVFADLKKCFIKGELDDLTGTHPVIQLIPPFKKNYYCIGVITTILSIVSFNVQPPQALDMFVKYLTSFISKKTFYVERAQFLILRYIYANLRGEGGGQSTSLVHLARGAEATAIHLGFHTNLKNIYDDKSIQRGKICYSENLWLWILYTDIEVSFDLGTPLSISDDFINHTIFDDPDFGTLPFLKSTIKALRRALNAINSRNKAPDLKVLIRDLLDFTKTTFKPVSYYLNPENIKETDVTEIDALTLVMTMVSNFATLHRLCSNDYSPEIINTTIQTSFVGISLLVTMIETFFKLDSDILEKEPTYGPGHLTPNLALAISVLHKHFTRVISEPYALFGGLLSMAEFEVYRNKYPLSSTFDIPLDSLEIVCDHYVGIKPAIEVMYRSVDRLESEENKEMTRRLKRGSYSFVTLMALERICRGLTKNAFETRKFSRINYSANSCNVNTTTSNLISPSDAPEIDLSDDEWTVMAEEFWKKYELSYDGIGQNENTEFLGNLSISTTYSDE